MSHAHESAIFERAPAAGAADCAEQLYALEQLVEAFNPTPELRAAVARGLRELRVGFPKLDSKHKARMARLQRYLRKHRAGS